MIAFNIRLSREEHAYLKIASGDAYQSMNSYIRDSIMKRLKEEGYVLKADRDRYEAKRVSSKKRARRK